MTTIVALTLSLMSTGLKDIHEKNEAVFAKRSILSSISDHLGQDLKSMTDDQVLELFNTKIEQIALDINGKLVDGIKPEKIKLADEFKKPEAERIAPLFIYTADNGEKFNIFSVRGKGLWDAIWGNVAISSDLNTVTGVAFDHTAETPGLGAEIKDNADFGKQFIGKKLFTSSGEYKSVSVVKGGIKQPEHQVDAISGATITCVGVSDMMIQGLNFYKPYFEQHKK